MTILNNIRNAFEEQAGGKVIFLEAVVAGPGEPDMAKWIDLEMMAGPGGRERTREEFRRLFGKAGFQLTRVVPTKSHVERARGDAARDRVQVSVRFSCPAAPELPPFFCRAEHVSHRDMDDTGRNELAGISSHEFRIPAGHRRVLRPDSGISSYTIRRSMGRPPEPAHSVEVDPAAFDAAVVCSGCAHVQRRVNIWHVAALMMFQGIVNAFDMPARQTFVIEMVQDRADLPNAIALNSSMLNGSRLIGPSIAGAIIAFAGEGYCFLIDGFSYLAVIGSLYMMHIHPGLMRLHENIWLELREGLGYIREFVPIRSILTLVASLSFAGAPYSILLPVFASAILHGGPHTLGFLTAAAGVGALLSAVTLAVRRTIVGLGRMMKITSFTFGAGLIAFALSSNLSLSLLLMFGCGFSMMQSYSAGNTIMQTIVAEGKRGRVMSFYTLAVIGMQPFGSLVSGIMADRIGAPLTVGIGGALIMACSLWFARKLDEIRTIVRPIYRELGILPEVD